jgi:hypothetical protein
MKQLASDMYSKRINQQGGVHESDAYADALGDTIQGLEKAIIPRSLEKTADATYVVQKTLPLYSNGVDTGIQVPVPDYDGIVDVYWGGSE